MAAATATVASATPQVDTAAVDKAFETLKTYDWGADRTALDPIDQAVIDTAGDTAARAQLEARLIGVLNSDASRSAKDYVCRTLRTIGTAQSVPSLAALLSDGDLAHMARYALERNPAAEAGAALRDALPKLDGALQVGVMGSLGVRRDAASVPAVAGLLGSSDKTVAATAARTLGLVGTAEAAQALSEAAKKATADAKLAVTDACLICAEGLLAQGIKPQAIEMYKSLSGDDQPSHVRVAAQHGMLSAMRKSD
jgi:HEAT repeat protein